MNTATPDYIAFTGNQRLIAGSLQDVVLEVKSAAEADPLVNILVFNATTSEQIDFDTHGTRDDVLQRLAPLLQVKASDSDSENDPSPPAGPGRPRLGVVAREVTLLPRHWEWLSKQPGGASVTLRKLVENARRENQESDRLRDAKNSVYRFMSAIAGNLEGFEEASRALFASNHELFKRKIAEWPTDIRAHLQALSSNAFEEQAR